ncbi:unnamed protein product [Eruca vesicaria subsp. sativa]|uniref:Uncharacterized protein n=1 Tax=Eruca vesicaria subsp. sativa TaxID=29727 RepID=A0ABC8K496_ERUVS|nr:unnamed protein product [Eruca vesicaria subsp. sativa]
MESQMSLDFAQLFTVSSLYRFFYSMLTNFIFHAIRCRYDVLAWTLYGIITSQVGDKDTIVQIADVGDMSLRTFLKDVFEHDSLPVVPSVHMEYILLFVYFFAYGIKFLNFQKKVKEKKNLCSIVFGSLTNARLARKHRIQLICARRVAASPPQAITTEEPTTTPPHAGPTNGGK